MIKLLAHILLRSMACSLPLLLLLGSYLRLSTATLHHLRTAAKPHDKNSGSHMKAATDAINKLVDESIVNRVEEAEKEVSQMLLRNIEHHIQDAGKIFKTPDDKTTLTAAFDRNVCRDKLDSCPQLSQAGVCKTSRDAMRENCRHTCNYCHVMLDHDMQAKLAKELETHSDGGDKVLTIKFRHKVKPRHHLKQHHLVTDQVGMLGNDLGMKMHEMHENELHEMHEKPELEKAPVEDEDPHSRDDDEQAKELERIKGEANKLLAAQRKIKQEKLAEKERHEAEKLLETEKKIKEEEQKEIRKHHKKKKKKMVVHKPVTKGTATSSFLSQRPKMKADDIPFLNEDPYPLSDFVTEYDKTVAYGRNAVLRRQRARKMDENMLNYNDRAYIRLGDDSFTPSGGARKRYKFRQRQRDDLDYKIDSNILNRNNEHHPLLRRLDTQDSDKRHLNIQQYDIKPQETDDETIDDIDDDKYESTSNVTPTDVTPSPILNEKDGISGKAGVTMLGKDTKKGNVVENNGYDKSKMRPDIDTMIDKAFGEVLDSK